MVALSANILRKPPLPPLAPMPLVTVAVCTRDRPASLRRCLDALCRLDYIRYEMVVVDNAPNSTATADVVATFDNVRYVVEARPGLDRARNRAIAEARGHIVAFTDDDVVVTADWLTLLVATFVEHNAGCVTGNVLPYELVTRAQKLFEVYGGFSRGWMPRVCTSPTALGMSYPVSTHLLGTGANMAFRRSIFADIGLFDEALDAGTRTGGGGDLEMFLRVLKYGYPLVYEPMVLVRHAHRRDMAALRRQLRNNGSAYYAYLTAAFLRYPDERLRIVRFGLWWWCYWNMSRLTKVLRHPGYFPLDLIFAEMFGAFRGPLTYFQERWSAHPYSPDPNKTLWLDGEILTPQAEIERVV